MIWKEVAKYYINLDSRPDRNERMIRTLMESKIAMQRFPAIRYLDCDLTNPKYKVMLKRTPGAIGCFESQMAVMRKGLEQGKDVLVCEDDLEFASDYLDRIKIIETFCDTHDWDIVWLGGTVHINPAQWHSKKHNPDLPDCHCTLERDVEQTDTPRIVRTYGMWSTFSYIVNVNSIPKILKMLDETMHLSMGIDWSFMSFGEKLKTFAFLPGTVKQYDGQSSIGNGITEFSLFKNLGAYWWQDKMDDFNPDTFNWAEAKKRNT